MKKISLFLVLFWCSSLVVAQNPTPSQSINERNYCKEIRIDDPKNEACARTCDTGQVAQCISVALDSKTPPICNCVKAEGREGVAAYSMCHAVRKDAEGHEWERCNIACDKFTVATCLDAPDYPAPGGPKCTCERKAAKK